MIQPRDQYGNEGQYHWWLVGLCAVLIGCLVYSLIWG
jgi:hypothetical protein